MELFLAIILSNYNDHCTIFSKTDHCKGKSLQTQATYRLQLLT